MAERLKVLLIEDNADGAGYIGRLFDRNGTAVVMEWAARLETGLKRIAAGGLDAALINLNHPDGDGISTLFQVRAQNPDVPIVVLTTLDQVETGAEALRQGAQDLIIKEHMTGELLHRVVRNAIEREGREKPEAKEQHEPRGETDARIHAIVNAALDCIITLDADGTILDFNPAAEKTFGYERGEVLGQQMGTLLLPEDTSKRQKRNFNKYAQNGEGSMLGTRIETKAIRKDGEKFIAEMATQPVPLHGTLVFTVFLRDITERKTAEEQLKRYSSALERSNRDLDQYAAIVSHDLLAPLRAVTGFCTLLERDYGANLDDKAAEYIQSIVGGAKRMQSLVKDLRAYSRVATEAKPLERLDCAAIVARALDNLEVEVLESEAKITNDPLPVVMADKTQLTQLFQNLIGNAIKYRGEGPPEIHISASNLGEEWQICVRDNGIGFDPAQQDRIFQIFRRLHADEEKYRGTGIGLAICERIVKRHHGRIWVESEPGRGSTFFFTLPTNPPQDD